MSLYSHSFPASDLWAGKRRFAAVILTDRANQRGSNWLSALPTLAPSDEEVGQAKPTEGEKIISQNWNIEYKSACGFPVRIIRGR